MLNFSRLSRDFLKFEGADRLDLVNRLSTNKVDTIDKFKCAKTILTSDKGRFVDLLTMYNFGDFVFATCSKGNSANVIGYLDKYTIMDDFRTTDMTGTHESILFTGNDAEAFTEDVFGTKLNTLGENDFRVITGNGCDAIISPNDDSFGGFLFIHASDDSVYWNSRIFSELLLTKYEMNELTGNEFEKKRIEYGIPAFGNEMTELTNPLECGLNKYVNFTKGCYIGQEVIARLDAYDKISKHMVGIISDEEIPQGVKIGEVKITTGGKECGFVTSSMGSNGGSIGIGFVKTIFLDYNKQYSIKWNDKILMCRINRLPFDIQD
jgi:tRNA-modifying protein YgfZ